jgi:hypothetical protein
MPRGDAYPIVARATARIRAAVRNSAPWLPGWLEQFGRFGYAGKSIAYILVGIIAVRAAAGARTEPQDAPGALAVVLARPLGRIMLAIITVGLVGYALWQLVAAITDGEDDGSDAGGVLNRIGKIIGFFAYSTLGLQAVRLLLGHPLDSSGAAQDWSTRLMGSLAGISVIVLVGCGILVYGLYELYQCYRPNVQRHVDLSSLSHRETTSIIWLGRFGLAARGIVFGIIGWFLIRSAIRYNPRQAAGLGRALQILERQSYGQLLLALVALGLIAYGAFEMVNARYRRLSAGGEKTVGQ